MTKSYASRPLRSAKSYKNLALVLKVSSESRKRRMFGLDWLSHEGVLIFQMSKHVLPFEASLHDEDPCRRVAAIAAEG